MEVEKEIQVGEIATRPISRGGTSDAFAIRVVGDKRLTDLDPNIVDFDHNDPDDPQNWSHRYKWSITMLLAIIVLRSPLPQHTIST